MGFEEIKYLAHNTTIGSFEGIVREGSLLTEYDVWRRKKRASSVFRLRDAFPGVFMSWYLGGKDVMHALSMGGSVTLVFGQDLVRRQHNFHLNQADKNGYLIEEGTFSRATTFRTSLRRELLWSGTPTRKCRTLTTRSSFTTAYRWGSARRSSSPEATTKSPKSRGCCPTP